MRRGDATLLDCDGAVTDRQFAAPPPAFRSCRYSAASSPTTNGGDSALSVPAVLRRYRRQLLGQVSVRSIEGK
jgi:hypothetical protein